MFKSKKIMLSLMMVFQIEPNSSTENKSYTSDVDTSKKQDKVPLNFPLWKVVLFHIVAPIYFYYFEYKEQKDKERKDKKKNNKDNSDARGEFSCDVGNTGRNS
ncbi:hypothetical protein JOC77_002972 [Peribacillus deserti]|uniref:YqzE family protein n=1 Tax=Peribacillus deserti TaxID=673318 RepID=A0ABS2QK44_9BACI|nr:hypothetical protein [Peribacillus deserti]MBM7693532.1 hypothetical protein [Peribacillus deserti]